MEQILTLKQNSVIISSINIWPRYCIDEVRVSHTSCNCFILWILVMTLKSENFFKYIQLPF